jgi:ABC-type uncharacterized transport system ATPase subunit
MNCIKTCTGGCILIKGMHPFISQSRHKTFYGQSMGNKLTTWYR